MKSGDPSLVQVLSPQYLFVQKEKKRKESDVMGWDGMGWDGNEWRENVSAKDPSLLLLLALFKSIFINKKDRVIFSHLHAGAPCIAKPMPRP